MELEIFSSCFGGDGITGGDTVFDIEIRRFVDVPHDLITSITLGYTTGQGGHRGDVPAVRGNLDRVGEIEQSIQAARLRWAEDASLVQSLDSALASVQAIGRIINPSLPAVKVWRTLIAACQERFRARG